MHHSSKPHQLLRYALITTLLLFTAACSDIKKAQVADVLDARDKAVSEKSIKDFSILITDQYHDHGRSKIDVVAQMINLFDHFEQLSMSSHDRVIHIVDDTHVQCEQAYTLKAFADNEWRSIVQKEQLGFVLENGHWKINTGL